MDRLQPYQCDVLIDRINRHAKKDPNLARDILAWMLLQSQEEKVAPRKAHLGSFARKRRVSRYYL